MRVALDTNTISYAMRGVPSVLAHWRATPRAELGVPAIVAYELRYGLARLPETVARPKQQALQTVLSSVQILGFDDECSRLAAALRAELERAGTPIGPHDILIAATAMRHGATLVTANLREFQRVRGLSVTSWHDALG